MEFLLKEVNTEKVYLPTDPQVETLLYENAVFDIMKLGMISKSGVTFSRIDSLYNVDEYHNWLDERAKVAVDRGHHSWNPFDIFERFKENPNVDVKKKPGFGEKGNHIDPPHYQNFFKSEALNLSMQWLENQSGIMAPERFEGALELMQKKYIDRRGGKDEEVQELKKALWYLKYWIAYLVNGRKFTRVEAVNKLLEE